MIDYKTVSTEVNKKITEIVHNIDNAYTYSKIEPMTEWVSKNLGLR